MFKWKYSQGGQAAVSEYVIIFFVVIACAVAMTAYVQRALQARILGADKYAIDVVKNACWDNCLSATGGTINYEYEPYYAQMASTVSRSSDADQRLFAGNHVMTNKIINELTESQSVSVQLPPKDFIK